MSPSAATSRCYKVLIDGTPELANEQIKISRLRGRGGAGFSTGLKWEFLRKAKADHKYLICFLWDVSSGVKTASGLPSICRR